MLVFDRIPRGAVCRRCGLPLLLAFDAHTGKSVVLERHEGDPDATHVIQLGGHVYHVDDARPPVAEMGPYRLHPRHGSADATRGISVAHARRAHEHARRRGGRFPEPRRRPADWDDGS